jgi:hypothetical protein
LRGERIAGQIGVLLDPSSGLDDLVRIG